jgi:hypothetical protein
MNRGCPKSPHFSFGTAQSGRKWRETGRKSMLYPKIDKKNDQKWENKKGLSAFETAPWPMVACPRGMLRERRLGRALARGSVWSTAAMPLEQERVQGMRWREVVFIGDTIGRNIILRLYGRVVRLDSGPTAVSGDDSIKDRSVEDIVLVIPATCAKEGFPFLAGI